MQTFLPYPSFVRSVRCLDWRRLNKQRIEALQIYRIVSGETPESRWRFHPAVRMWDGYQRALALYYNSCVLEWERRGYNNSMELLPIRDYEIQYPWWLGRKEFHSSHRQTLLWKDYEYYSQFRWKEEGKYEYWWPVNKDGTKNINEEQFLKI